MSTPNWPIRVGGEYRSLLYPKSQYARVVAIEGDRIIKQFMRFDGNSHAFADDRDSMPAEVFRACFLPEDQSPIPELVKALEEARAYIDNDRETLERSFLPDPNEDELAHLESNKKALTLIRAALAKAGAK